MKNRFLKGLIGICIMAFIGVTSIPTTTSGAVGDTFIVPTSTGSYDANVTYKIISEPEGGKNGTVAIGNGSEKAVAALGFTSLALTDTVTNLGKTYDVVRINNHAFHDCSKLNFTSLPSKITSIGASAFAGCENLVLTGGLPSGVTAIENGAFDYCKKLALTSLPSGLITIGDNAFDTCYALSISSIPNSVRSIGSSAFVNDEGLIFMDLNNVETIGALAFNDCTKLTSIIANEVTSIDSYAFWGCNKLASVNGLNYLTAMGHSAFRGCSMLSISQLPQSVRTIGFDTFADCTGITGLSMPGVETVGAGAFRGCSGLTKVDMPNVLTIEGGAFKNCSKLKDLTITQKYRPADAAGTDTFEGTPSPINVHVSYNTKSNWESRSPWSDASKFNIIEPVNGTVTPTSMRYDKHTAAQGISFTLDPGAYSLSDISCGADILNSPDDYTVNENVYTISQSYLNAKKNGVTKLTFNMDGGSDPSVSITIFDSSIPPVGPISPAGPGSAALNGNVFTGDAADLWLWSLIALASCSLIIYTLRRWHRSR